MTYEIFISYRRSDSAGHARFLIASLSTYFDKTRIFFDRGSIESGDLFPDQLRQGVAEAKAILVLIAPDWLTVTGADGKPRLDDPHDFVRQEISQALELNHEQ